MTMLDVLSMPTMEQINKLKKDYKAVSFFSGCGGSSTGYKLAGFDMLYANEFIPEAQKTYAANHPKTRLDGSDIRTLDPKKVMKELGIKRGELDLLDGSPPCHPAGTLVFTKRGYVEIQDVVEGDYVLTHKNRWRKVSGTTKRRYKGPMLTINTMNAEPVHCTPNHPFYFMRKGKKRWDHAANLDSDCYIKVPRDTKGHAFLPAYSGVDIGVGYNRTTGDFAKTVSASYLKPLMGMYEFWWVVGRFLGDGWVHERRKQSAKNAARRPAGLPVKGVIICCNPHNDEQKHITDVLDRLGWKYSIKKRRTATRICLKGTGEYGAKTELVDFFKQFGQYCHGKYVPSFVFDLPSDLKEAIVDGYLSADGHFAETKYGSQTACFASVSRQLVYGIVRLINDSKAVCVGRIGAADSNPWNIEGRSGMTRPTWGCKGTIEGVGDSLGYTADDKGDLWVRIRGASAYQFDGYVYNLHVDEDESFTANGLASHNCSSFSNAGTRDKGWGKVKKYSDSEQRTDDLFDEYVRMVDAFYPKVFVAENVPGLVEGKAQGYFVEILKKLKAIGYNVSVRVLNASYLGVPQARRRLIFVGVRKDLKIAPVHPRPYTYQLSVRDVLPHILYIKNKRKSILTYVPSDVPSPTITASDGQTSETAGFSCGGFVEDKTGVRRKYKISELKKICSFPQDFKLTGTFEQKWERLGRAVPPLMMYNIALTIREEILDVHYKRKHRKDIYWSDK